MSNILYLQATFPIAYMLKKQYLCRPFAKGHFSSLPIVLSFSSLPLPPVLFLSVVWQVFRLLSRPRRFAGSPRNLDFWGAFPASIFMPLHLTPYTFFIFRHRDMICQADWVAYYRRRPLNKSRRTYSFIQISHFARFGIKGKILKAYWSHGSSIVTKVVAPVHDV